MTRVVLIYPGQGRAARIKGVADGTVPRDFFYGYLALQGSGCDAAVADSRADPRGAVGRIALWLERVRNRLMNVGFSNQRVRALDGDLAGRDLAISFTDGFSLSLGRYGRKERGWPLLVGGFHGLSDWVEQAPALVRPIARRQIRHAVHRLDHLFFFGEPDRQQAIRLYGLPPERTSLFPFGIDTAFWCPDASVAAEDTVLSVGSDPKRDFATLVRAPTAAKIQLLTRLPVEIPADGRVELIRGSYHGSAVDDRVLRTMYRTAMIVAVPLTDVWQPTGYSVTLQAMACGRPVILSDIRGLWDRDAFVSEQNCVLVPPGDPAALAAAIDRLRGDASLRQRLGAAARETALRRFDLLRMNAGLMDMVNSLGQRPAQFEAAE